MAGKRLSLATLAGQTVETVPGSSKPTLVHVAPDQVAATPLNPRQDFDPAKLEELGSSMAEGQLQPCVGITRARYLKLFPEHEELLPDCRIVMAAGERRWKAALKVGLPTLDVHVREDIAESRVRFLAAVLTENVERSNFNYIEEARGLQQMLELSDGNQTQAAKTLKKSKQWFSQRIGILRLSEEMQQLVIAGELTAFRDMRSYAALPPEKQLAAWQASRVEAERRKAEPKPVTPAPTAAAAQASPTDLGSGVYRGIHPAVPTTPTLAPTPALVRSEPSAPAPEPDVPAAANQAAGQDGSPQELRPEPPAQEQEHEPQAALPEPRSSNASAPSTGRQLPDLEWEAMADALIAELPVEDRHRMTTKLLRVMTAEKSNRTSA